MDRQNIQEKKNIKLHKNYCFMTKNIEVNVLIFLDENKNYDSVELKQNKTSNFKTKKSLLLHFSERPPRTEPIFWTK